MTLRNVEGPDLDVTVAASMGAADALRFVRVPSTLLPGEPWLVFRSAGGPPTQVPKLLCGLLRCCDGAGTLAEYEAEAIKRLGVRTPTDRTRVRQGLEELRRMELLVEEGRLATLCDAPVRVPPQIDTLVVLTREHPDACRRLTTSLLPLLVGKQVRLIICDDSSSDDSITKYRALASELAERHDHRVALINRQSKRTFIANLERLTANPAMVEALRFALAGTTEHGTGAGANRNATLLATLGRAFVCMDDDTIARFCRTGTHEGPWQACGGYDATAFRYFRSAESLAKQVQFERGVDPLAIHHALLGTAPSDVLRRFGVRTVGFSESLHATLSRSDARVAVTSTGVAGDSGMGNPSYALFPREPSFQALTDDPERYAEYRTTRQVVRGVERPTISGGNLLMMPCVGIDNTALLPACCPTFRNEDGLFAQALRLTQPGALVGHLPWAVAHEPVEQRSSSHEQLVQVPARYEAAHLLKGALNIAAIRHPHGTPALRTRTLGSGLRCVGSGSARDLQALTRQLCSAQWNTELRLLEHGLRARAASAPHWAEDARARITSLREALLSEDISLAGLPPQTSPLAAYESMARFIQQFGRLLEHWPSIVEAAMELDGQGRGLLDCAV